MDKLGVVFFGKIIVVLLALCLLFVFVNFSRSENVIVTATVGNENPIIVDINICDGNCGKYKEISPGSEFVIAVAARDPNGLDDINWDATEIEIYTTSDTNADANSWDHIILKMSDGSLTQVSEAYGCIAARHGSEQPPYDLNCFKIEASDWTVKFLEGGADVYVKIYDEYTTPASSELELAYVANSNGIEVLGTTGITLDTQTGTFSGSPNSQDNAFTSGQTGNGYIKVTHNGNQDLNLGMEVSDLTSDIYTIWDSNISWYLSNDTTNSEPFTHGDARDTIIGKWERGTCPDANTTNIYTWLDIPPGTPAGDYNGIFTITSEESS